MFIIVAKQYSIIYTMRLVVGSPNQIAIASSKCQQKRDIEVIVIYFAQILFSQKGKKSKHFVNAENR